MKRRETFGMQRRPAPYPHFIEVTDMPKRLELLGRRTLANEKMVNRVDRHKCGVTLWQM